MKFVKILFTIFMLIVCAIQISMVAFADDLYPDNTAPAVDNSYYNSSPVISEPSSPVISEPSSPVISEPSSPVISEPSSPVISEPSSPVISEPSSPVISEHVYRSDPVIVEAVSPITPSNTNGFQSVILGLLGNYSPVVVEYAYTSSQGYVSYLREIQPDYSWLAGAVIFLVVIYCLFRLIGALIKK